MADEDTKQVDEAVEKAEEAKEEAQEAATEAKAAVEEVKEVVAAETPKADEPAQAKPKASKKVSERSSSSNKDLEDIISKIEKLSVLELADLVHALEERFGVTAAAPMAVGPSTGPGPAAGEPQEEQTTFNVILASAGANKIGAIKAVRELVPTLGLKEAKDLVEAAPKPVMEGVNKERANEAKTKLTAAGATVELQ